MSSLWSTISSKLRKYPRREKVARLLIELGASIDDEGKVYFGPVEVPHSKIAKATGVDRRVVKETTEFMRKDPEIARIFKRLKPIGPSLVGVANVLGMGVLEVRADPSKPGIVAGVSSAIAKHDINIRQIIAEDPELVPDPKLYVVTEGKVPGKVIEELLNIPHVRSVSAM